MDYIIAVSLMILIVGIAVGLLLALIRDYVHTEKIGLGDYIPYVLASTILFMTIGFFSYVSTHFDENTFHYIQEAKKLQQETRILHIHKMSYRLYKKSFLRGDLCQD